MMDSASPEEQAHVIAKRPGMFMGSPVTFERAVAFIHGFELALQMIGKPVAAVDVVEDPTVFH